MTSTLMQNKRNVMMAMGGEKHPSVQGRLGCEARNQDNIEKGKENGNEVHGRSIFQDSI